jgi:outer membrane receptor protein involved in Fe transport
MNITSYMKHPSYVKHLGCMHAIVAFLLSANCMFAQAATEKTDDNDVVILPEFNVSTTRNDSYLATESASGTRIATDIINLPFSVSVLTEDFITDFSLFDLDEQAPFVSGMSPGDPSQGGGGGTRLRGFMVPYFRNGFYRTQAPDSNSIARVEVVKGPQSAIYGRVSPGGVINYISKKPQTKFRADMAYTVGSYDYNRASLGITGPLVSDRLFARADLGWYRFRRPTDFWYNKTMNLSGGVTWKITNRTSITFEDEYTKRVMQGGQSFTRWQRVASINGANVTITEGPVFNMPDRAVAERLTKYAANGANQQIDRISNSNYLLIEHRFPNDWSLRASLGYSTRLYEKKNATSTLGTWTASPSAAQQGVLDTLAGIWVDTTKGIWTGDRAGAYERIDYLEKGAQVDLTKLWRTTIRQRSLLTFDIFEQDFDRETWALSGAALDTALAALGFDTVAKRNAWKRPDPFNPDVSGYYAMPAFNRQTWTVTEAAYYTLTRYYYGGLLNHTVEMLDGRLALTGSIRQDWASYDYKRPLQTSPTSKLKNAKDDTNRFTYSLGVNYHIVLRKAVGYINYASGFDPSPQADPNTGEIMGNRTSKGGEGGLKGLLFKDALSYTLAVFRVDQTNETTANPDNPTGADPSLPSLIAGGDSRAKGMSIDLVGKVTEHLTLLGNISWVAVRITHNAANPALVGTRPLGGQNVPPRSYALAARYSFTKGWLKGARLGLNYQNMQEFLRIAQVKNAAGIVTTVPFNIPERNEWGGFVGYKIRLPHKMSLDLALNVLNIFDQKELTVAAFYPPGREFRFTATVRF